MYNVVHIIDIKRPIFESSCFCFLRGVEQLSQDVLCVFGKGLYTSKLLPFLRNSWSFWTDFYCWNELSND